MYVLCFGIIHQPCVDLRGPTHLGSNEMFAGGANLSINQDTSIQPLSVKKASARKTFEVVVHSRMWMVPAGQLNFRGGF
jgi:hypothetical protein